MRKRALVVGINNYPRSPLNGCINDANDISNILKTHENGNPNFSVKEIHDVATKGDLIGEIKELFNGENDTALFYFSGHGSINELGGYIITPDFSENDLGVSMEDILKLANGSKTKNRIIILDCCYSGAIANPNIEHGSLCTINKGVTILTASRDCESAIESNGRGIFTTLLLEGLKGGAANLEGKVTPSSIYAYIDQALGAWQQRPVFKTNVTEFNPIREVNPQVSKDIIRKLKEYFSSPSEEFKLDPSFEYTNSNHVEHEIVNPYADDNNVKIFKNLQKLAGVGLIVPVGEEHMYFAAMHSKSCKLTALGQYYWKLVTETRL